MINYRVIGTNCLWE